MKELQQKGALLDDEADDDVLNQDQMLERSDPALSLAGSVDAMDIKGGETQVK